MNNNIAQYDAWKANRRSQLQGILKTASAVKEAASMCAEDPTEKGKLGTPAPFHGILRSKLNLPENAQNNKEGKESIMTADPRRTGEGETVVMRDGTSRDNAVKSPTAPISKLAGSLKRSAGAVQADSFEMPTSMKDDADLMYKLAGANTVEQLAFIGQAMMATKEGQKFASDQLTKLAGIQEAEQIIANAAGTLSKQAAAHNVPTPLDFLYDAVVREQAITKIASTHNAWLDCLESNLEKKAYMQGAAAGDVAADAMAAGAPMDPAEAATMTEEVTDEDVLAALELLLSSGQITPEHAELVAQQYLNDKASKYTLESLGTPLLEAAAQGLISPEEAQMAAQQLLEAAMSGELPSVELGTAPAPAEVVDPMAAQAVKAASAVVQYLMGDA